MLSKPSIDFLQNNNSKVTHTSDQLILENLSRTTFVRSMFLVGLGFLIIPVVIVGGYKVAILSLLLIIYPIYKVLESAKVPKCLEFHLTEKYLNIYSRWGQNPVVKLPFTDITGLEWSVINEFLHASPFNQKVKLINSNIYLSLQSEENQYLISIKDNESEQAQTEQLIRELNALLA